MTLTSTHHRWPLALFASVSALIGLTIAVPAPAHADPETTTLLNDVGIGNNSTISQAIAQVVDFRERYLAAGAVLSARRCCQAARIFSRSARIFASLARFSSSPLRSVAIAWSTLAGCACRRARRL